MLKASITLQRVNARGRLTSTLIGDILLPVSDCEFKIDWKRNSMLSAVSNLLLVGLILSELLVIVVRDQKPLPVGAGT